MSLQFEGIELPLQTGRCGYHISGFHPPVAVPVEQEDGNSHMCALVYFAVIPLSVAFSVSQPDGWHVLCSADSSMPQYLEVSALRFSIHRFCQVRLRYFSMHVMHGTIRCSWCYHVIITTNLITTIIIAPASRRQVVSTTRVLIQYLKGRGVILTR